MKVTYLLSDIQRKILQYNPVALVREITEQAWRIFLNKVDELERGHKNSNRFIRCAPWICFIAIGSDTRTLDHRLLKYKKINTQTKFKLSYKMEKLLFYKGLDPLTSTSYHIEDNPIEDFRRRFEENIHSGKLESLKLDLQVKFGEYHIAYNVYDRLYIAEDVRRWNFEVEAKYSHLPLVRSMLIASQLSNYEELLLDGMPAKRFHQILNLIVLLFIECRGKFTQDKLYDLLQEKYKDRKSEVDIGSLKSDIDSVLYKLLCNDINASYKTFEKYLKKNFLYPPYYLNPFYTTPILSQEIGGIIEYFAPSPYILILSTGWLFWILVKDKINNNDLGTALHNYISAFLNHYKTIHNIDIIDLDKSNVNNSWKDLKKKADFVVETEHYKIIIECKNSLGFRTPLDKNSEDLSSLFNSWNRITKAIEQCNSTKSRLPCENKRIFNLIVVNEVVRGEAAAYIGFYDTNSFNKLELKWGEFSIISIAQFEYLVASNKLEEFIEECDLQSRKMVPRPHYDDIRKALNILFDVDLFLPPNYSFWEDGMRRLGINI